MAWIVSTVQSICLEDGLPDCPGFVVQEEGSSPTLTLVFEDRKTADECASAMKHIFDSALGIRGRVFPDQRANSLKAREAAMGKRSAPRPTPSRDGGIR